MALNINTRKLNDSLRMLNSFLMQNKLGELSNERYMETISEQDRLMRERQAAADVTAHKGRVESFELNKQEAIFKGLLKAAEDPGIKGLGTKAETLRLAGMMKEADAVDNEIVNRIESSVDSFVQTQTGKPLDKNGFRAMIMAGGLDKAMDAMKEGGVNRRFGAELPIQQQQAATSAGNLALARTKEGRAASGEMTQEDYYKNVSTKVQKAMDNISSLVAAIKNAKESGNPYDMGTILAEAGVDTKLIGGITPEALAKRLSNLSTLETEAMSGKLSREKMNYIDKSLDIFKDIEMPLEPIAGATAGAKGSALPAPTSGATMTPSPTPQAAPVKTIPANAPKAYNPTTGETAYWDGTQWIIVK